MESLAALLPFIPNLLRASLINIQLLFALIAVGYVLGTLIALMQVYGGRAFGTKSSLHERIFRSIPALVLLFFLFFGLPRLGVRVSPFLATMMALNVLIVLWQICGGRVLVVISRLYEWIFRSIPALVLLFLFYYGPPRFGLSVSAFLAATMALGFRSSAYQSQIFRGAIQAVPSGQMMAARSVGMSRSRAIVTIILPQAFRLSIPGWTNEFSSVVKDTTLAYVVGFNEIMRSARIIVDSHYELAMLALIAVALVFLALTYAGNTLMNGIERKFRIPGLQMPGAGFRDHSH